MNHSNIAYESVLVEWFMREHEGTLGEFFSSLGGVTPKQKTGFEYAIFRLREKGMIESIGYHGRIMNYRISESDAL